MPRQRCPATSAAGRWRRQIDTAGPHGTVRVADPVLLRFPPLLCRLTTAERRGKVARLPGGESGAGGRPDGRRNQGGRRPCLPPASLRRSRSPARSRLSLPLLRGSLRLRRLQSRKGQKQPSPLTRKPPARPLKKSLRASTTRLLPSPSTRRRAKPPKKTPSRSVRATARRSNYRPI